jgi:hypothetical protein
MIEEGRKSGDKHYFFFVHRPQKRKKLNNKNEDEIFSEDI